MAKYINTHWRGDPDSAIRRERRVCDYSVYLPDALKERTFQIDGTVAAEVSDAEAAIRSLNEASGVLTNTEALARLLLRAESVASSHIEGLQVGGRRLLQSEMEHDLGISSHDVTADEVLGNISAMEWAIQTVSQGDKITPSLIKEAHRRLLAGSRLEHEGGKLRTVQNWIGGNSLNPCSADFVPPPPEQVESLLEDLCAFCREDRLPPLVQAAIAHAQFETIHPFVDGNGRTGRALIHLVLRYRGLAPRVVPPISLILATRSQDYIDGLTKTRYVGAPANESANRSVNYWLDIFASCTRRAVQDALAFETKIGAIRSRWRASLGVRANSAVDLLISALPGAPILTVGSASAMIGRSFQATNIAVARLFEAGILTQSTWGRRNRAFEAVEIVDAFTDLERQLASPQGDTRYSRPAREVPLRRIAETD